MLPPAAPPPAPPEVVQTVVVRAARLAPAQAETVFSVVQVNRVALQAQPRLDEALEEVPGLSLFRRSSSLSANPTVEGVSLREIGPTGAGRALVTLDGVPQGDPFGGWVIWSGLPSDAIQSVDVVRGAGAGPYGAGALTGTVALKERVLQPGDFAADGEAGGIGYLRGSAVGDVAAGPGDLFVGASGEHSNGWIPVIAGRGAADKPLELDDRSFAARYNVVLGPGVLSARIAEYGQDQATGVANGFARANGATESLSWAAQPTANALGAQLQVWARQSGFSQLSSSEAVGHATATPADLQYATPADGLGVNGAIRRATSHSAGSWASTRGGQRARPTSCSSTSPAPSPSAASPAGATWWRASMRKARPTTAPGPSPAARGWTNGVTGTATSWRPCSPPARPPPTATPPPRAARCRRRGRG